MTETQEAEPAQPAEPVRSRTFSWSDPAVHASTLGTRPGLETLQAMIAGELPVPPIMQTIDVDGFEADEGQITVMLTPREFHYNPLGSVHGGILATLLDTAAACAVYSLLPAGQGYTSQDLNVKFLRPATVDSGRLRCRGSVLARTRRNALAEARISDQSGQLIAYATSSCLIFDLPATRAGRS